MRRQAPQDDEDIFSTGEVIDEQYTVLKKLGRGGYGVSYGGYIELTVPGEIYACKTKTGVEVALKVERECKPGNLKEEEMILKRLRGYCAH